MNLTSLRMLFSVAILWAGLLSGLSASARPAGDWSSESKTKAKRALIIGLGEQQDKAWSKINGDRDVPMVRRMLEASGFTDIRTLVNRQATKAGIVKAFGRLAAECQAGDVVYVHFSGHGQQMTDLDGDEADGYDEAWVPYDACMAYCSADRGEKHISDDELGNMLASIRRRVGKSGKILVVVDACHSGGITRGMEEAAETQEAERGARDAFCIPGKAAPKGTVKQKEENWLTISACKSYESNFELKDKKVGKLSYALCQMLGKDLKLTNAEIEARLRAFMKRNPGRMQQTPVITGMKKAMSVSGMFM